MFVNTPYLETLSQSLLRELQQLDRQLAPQGMYAAEEHAVAVSRERWLVEWNECMSSCLRSHGCQAPKVSHLKGRWDSIRKERRLIHAFVLPNNEPCAIELFRLSKIKVRRYGNAHRIDPSRHFSERWQNLNLSARLKRQDRWPEPQMVLLVGFDDKAAALSKELAALKESTNWQNNGWSFLTLHWPDPHGRGFYTRVALWFTLAQHSED